MTGRHRRGTVELLTVSIQKTRGGIMICFVSTKGGAGKSTLAWHLAFEFARWGLRVQLINADPQRSVPKAAATRKMHTAAPLPFEVRVYDGSELWKDIKKYGNFDVTIIDVQGRDGEAARSGIVAGALHPHGLIVIPVEPSPFDIWGTDDTVVILHEAIALLKDPRLWGRVRTVLNRYAENESVTGATIRSLARHPAKRTASSIKRHTAFPTAIISGRGVNEYEPHGDASKEIAALSIELANDALKEKRSK